MPVLYMDLDGTILDVWPRYYSVMKLYFERELSVQFPNLEEYRRIKLTLIRDEYIIQYLSQGHIPSEGEVVRDYLSYKKKMLESEDMLSMDTVIGQFSSFVAQVKPEYKLHLLSVRRNQQLAIRQLQDLGIAKYLHQVDIVSPAREFNPKWDLIKHGASRQDVIVGDSEIDINCGIILEMRTFHVSTGLRSYDHVSRYGQAFRLHDYTDVVSHL